MAASSWHLRLNPDSKKRVDAWLNEENLVDYDYSADGYAVTLDFYDIDVAFRFRLAFDEELMDS